MKIYNTMSRSLEEFVPIEKGKVRMYVCGPTVYSYIHIGNARPMIFFDTVRRYFKYAGYDVRYVSNFTDVDDKIIKAANDEGVSSEEISERFILECKKDMASLNVLPADVHPKATEEIDGMVEMIDTLIGKKHAYTSADGTVYFRSKSFKGYGKLSRKNIDELRTGERELKVDGSDQKEDFTDFVLWKPAKAGAPLWHSPWCDGRPGWHSECSVMSTRYLGEQIDIHGGGEDLVFPHHENEIAQSECASGKTFAKYWMHNAFLNIDNKKMSKSLGNFFTVRDILKKYSGQVVRFFMLSAHYRNPLNFSDALLESAKNSYERILNCVANLDFLLRGDRAGLLTETERELLKEAADIELAFRKAMDDDFNTADALAAIFELVRFANTNCSEKSSREFLKRIRGEIADLMSVCGLNVTISEEENQTAGGLSGEEIEAKIAERTEAKKNKDFALSDSIRAELLEKGVIIEDTREGTRWKRV